MHSILFDSVASMFSQDNFIVRIQSLMVLTSILKVSEDEEILKIVVETGVFDAYEIMECVDDISTQLEFLYSMQHFIEYSKAHNKQDWIQIILDREFFSDILNEYIDSEYSKVADNAQILLDEINELANQ